MNLLTEGLHIKRWLNGRPYRPGESDAPALVLFFSPKCHGCVFTALPAMLELYKKVDPAKLRFLAVQIHDAPDSFFEQRFDVATFPFPVGLDDDLQTYRNYDCDGTPHWFLVDAGGHILHSIFGSDLGNLARLTYALLEVAGVEITFE